MSSVETPLRPVIHPPHTHAQGHDHPAPAKVAPRPPLTLLTSGLGLRLGAAGVLVALLWAVVRWALA